MVISFSAITVAPAVAIAAVASPEAETKFHPKKPIVNDGGSVTLRQDNDDPYRLTITVDPDDGYTLNDWGIPGVEGVDYTIISENGNTIVIRVINEDLFEGTAISPTYKDSNGKPGKPSDVKKDDSNKAPQTGVASVLGATAIMGAGVAVLSAIKKRNND